MWHQINDINSEALPLEQKTVWGKKKVCGNKVDLLRWMLDERAENSDIKVNYHGEILKCFEIVPANYLLHRQGHSVSPNTWPANELSQNETFDWRIRKKQWRVQIKLIDGKLRISHQILAKLRNKIIKLNERKLRNARIRNR